VGNETIGEFGFRFRGVYTKEHFFHGLLSFHNIYFLHFSVLVSINWRPKCLWHLPIRGVRG